VKAPAGAGKWRVLGSPFVPPAQAAWLRTHAALPVADGAGTRRRIYFSSRDDLGRARIGWMEVDLTRPSEVLAMGPEPALDLGPLGAFDDHGATSSWLVDHERRKFLYYTGWKLGVTVPFYLAIGLAVSDDGGGTFRRVSEGPLLGTDGVDPYLTASPCVLIEDGLWRMWYVSGSRWEREGERAKHHYHIRYAESGDGLSWRRTGRVCIDYASPDEYAIARPSVRKDGGLYRMWYCHRGARYRIGYAESPDGLRWQRKDDEAGLEPSGQPWDAEMQAYPFVFDEGGRRYMLYNGDGYGRTGIGLAVLA